ncbi:MAG TPA: ABC transporter permease [Thermoleophilaceae bacterium]|nr:ABC transporter permease [Thermoleophilaceae bacterium]
MRELLRRPSAVVGIAIIALVLFLAIFGSLVAPFDPAAQDTAGRLKGPSGSHLLGTDYLGRDLLSRIIAGTRIAFEIALPTVTVALVVGLALGIAGGYLGGKTDAVVLFVADFLAAFPGLVLALAVIALLGPSVPNLIGVLAIAFIPGYTRVSRASVLAVKENQFVLVERALGASSLRIAARHILPNIGAPLLILVAMDIPLVMVAEAGLSFLGLGVPPPEPSWGSILSAGFAQVRESTWSVLWPALALGVTMVAFTLVAEALRDVTDPKASGMRRLRRVT